MKNISISKNKAVVKLNKDIYLKRAVLITCEMFSEACWVNLNLDDCYYTVELIPKHKSVNVARIAHEFLNYTLAVMQNV